jgi:hypothetical protein
MRRPANHAHYFAILDAVVQCVAFSGKAQARFNER